MGNYKNSIVALGVVICLLLSSCAEKPSSKAKSLGKNTDVLVCANTSTLENLSSTILGTFEKDQPYFVFGGEPYFNAIKVKLEGLDGDLMYHRTIVILAHDKNKALIKEKFEINIDELNLKMKDGHMTVLKNPWAAPQHVILIYAKTEKDLREYFIKNEEKILHFTLDVQTKDLSQWYGASTKAMDNYNAIKKEYGVGVNVPANYVLRYQKDGFFWFMEDTENYTSSITVYAYPYKDTSQFNKDKIIALRDSLAKIHIPGEQKGTYMTTASKDKYLRFEKSKYYNNTYVKEIRGKWLVKGEFKAGPFINYSILDEVNQRILMVEGFLMYPDTKKIKSPFLRTYESLPWSFK